MVDRDGPGANFIDFDAKDLDRYFAKKKNVEGEPDFERTNSDLVYNLENTQQGNTPPQAVDWRSSGQADLAGVSDENRKKLAVQVAGMSSEDTYTDDE